MPSEYRRLTAKAKAGEIVWEWVIWYAVTAILCWGAAIGGALFVALGLSRFSWREIVAGLVLVAAAYALEHITGHYLRTV